VVAELALSLMLLTGAGLLIRSFIRLQAYLRVLHGPHHFDAGSGKRPKYEKVALVDRLFQDIGDRVSHLAGVKTKAWFPRCRSPEKSVGRDQRRSYTPPPEQELQVDLRIASADYFRTMSIPLLKGRFFSEHDTSDTLQMAIVDERFARRFWPHDNPIGKHLWFDDPKKPMTIAGVVGPVRQYGLDSAGRIAVYFPHRQQLSRNMYLVARTSSDAAGLAGAITRRFTPSIQRCCLRRAYHAGPAVRFSGPPAFLLHHAGRVRRLRSAAGGGGVFGVMSWLVSQTTHDMGVRLALGARRGDIVGLVCGRA